LNIVSYGDKVNAQNKLWWTGFGVEALEIVALTTSDMVMGVQTFCDTKTVAWLGLR